MNIKRFVTLSVLFLLALTMNACTLSAPAILVTQASEIPNTSGNRPQFIVGDNGLYVIENNEPRLLIDLTTLIIEAPDPVVGPQGPQGPKGDQLIPEMVRCKFIHQPETQTRI